MEEQEEIRERIDEQELAKKNANIAKEKKKISKLFAKIDKNKRTVVEKLIENVAFMSITLDELKEDIKICILTVKAIFIKEGTNAGKYNISNDIKILKKQKMDTID